MLDIFGFQTEALMPTASQRVIPITTASGPAVSASEKRRGLIFVAPAANRYTLSMDIPAVLDQGLTVYPGDRSTDLSWNIHGNMCQRAWQAISAVANQSITFYEIYD